MYLFQLCGNFPLKETNIEWYAKIEIHFHETNVFVMHAMTESPHLKLF